METFFAGMRTLGLSLCASGNYKKMAVTVATPVHRVCRPFQPICPIALFMPSIGAVVLLKWTFCEQICHE